VQGLDQPLVEQLRMAGELAAVAGLDGVAARATFLL
jgi:hypothetical protein